MTCSKPWWLKLCSTVNSFLSKEMMFRNVPSWIHFSNCLILWRLFFIWIIERSCLWSYLVGQHPKSIPVQASAWFRLPWSIFHCPSWITPDFFMHLFNEFWHSGYARTSCSHSIFDGGSLILTIDCPFDKHSTDCKLFSIFRNHWWSQFVFMLHGYRHSFNFYRYCFQ